jgi:hypothetical protein
MVRMAMATYEEPLPKWLEEEMEQQGVMPKWRERELFKWRERELFLQKPDKRDPSEVSKPAYGKGEECQF